MCRLFCFGNYFFVVISVSKVSILSPTEVFDFGAASAGLLLTCAIVGAVLLCPGVGLGLFGACGRTDADGLADPDGCLALAGGDAAAGGVGFLALLALATIGAGALRGGTGAAGLGGAGGEWFATGAASEDCVSGAAGRFDRDLLMSDSITTSFAPPIMIRCSTSSRRTRTILRRSSIDAASVIASLAFLLRRPPAMRGRVNIL